VNEFFPQQKLEPKKAKSLSEGPAGLSLHRSFCDDNTNTRTSLHTLPWINWHQQVGEFNLSLSNECLCGQLEEHQLLRANYVNFVHKYSERDYKCFQRVFLFWRIGTVAFEVGFFITRNSSIIKLWRVKLLVLRYYFLSVYFNKSNNYTYFTLVNDITNSLKMHFSINLFFFAQQKFINSDEEQNLTHHFAFFTNLSSMQLKPTMLKRGRE
jgi:hypothetical protein